MIVFSATHNTSGRVFIGSCRIELDFHWALLVTQADQGVGGDFFEHLRTDGANSFELEEYAYADSPREVGELVRDAIAETGGDPIRSQLRQPRKLAVTQPEIDELEVTVDDCSDDDIGGWLADRQQQARTEVAAQTKVATTAVATKVQAKVTVDAVLRETRTTEQAAEMRSVMAGIEARRRSMRKSPPKTAARNGTASSDSAKRVPKKESAAARERRIKAALAEQKDARAAERQNAIAAEADEMSAILARLDARNKVADSIKRRR